MLPIVAIWLGMTGDHLHGAQVGIVAVWKTTITVDQSYIHSSSPMLEVAGDSIAYTYIVYDKHGCLQYESTEILR